MNRGEHIIWPSLTYSIIYGYVKDLIKYSVQKIWYKKQFSRPSTPSLQKWYTARRVILLEEPNFV